MPTKMDKETVWETNIPLQLVGRGKVRDVYAVGEDKLLIVTTDRLSAFDVVLPNPIPFKGKVLNQISVFWFAYFGKAVPNHLITADVSEMELPKEILKNYRSQIEGRSMLVHRTKPFTVECVVRGYVTGSGWKDYQKTGAVCGHVLPEDLKQCEKLPQPIFTPATKETSGHDINIDFEEASKRIGEENACRLRDLSFEIYKKGADYAATRGILIADTKFEFGIWQGELILIDEVLTPDSSRFWPKDNYQAGQDQPSFDKQIVRNYLLDIQWNQKPPAPELPEDVVKKTSEAYLDVFKRLTGKALEV
ncbi:MAG TPA: phosphoribosylaminoimidazolesuccinocarboxamide synthase [bacterium]|nr:phosphoribosylaminoimidazolesuccinocarboxamide synthase [bacterium]